ncbi:MAG: sulfatase-like hydrolase/transferase, partial [Verrucomicrobiales bacterium]|nr:sulfatase-like hydrolase/transferase [Verrucomicrobiales bacterium]
MKLLFSLCVALLLASVCSADDRPNIVLVMADDHGYGDAGFTGHPFVKTPHMDAMAKDSVVFDRFYAAAPVCSPTRGSVMTGRTPMRTNVPNHGHYMRPHEVTVAEALRDAGYVTGHFGKWHIGSVQPDSPTSPGGAGFDEWVSGLNFFDIDPYLSKNGDYINPKGQGSVISMDETIKFLKNHKDGDKPIFSVTWFPAPHGPFRETPVDFPGGESLYKDAKKNRGYFLEITLLDQQLGRLRQSLRDMGIADNTILWYTSDNGGLVVESSGGRNKKGSIYEGGLRVPSILEWPGKLKPRTIRTPACSFDMYPTLLAIGGAKVDHQPHLDGIDLAGVIAGEQTTRPAMGFWHHHTKGQGTYSDRV